MMNNMIEYSFESAMAWTDIIVKGAIGVLLLLLYILASWLVLRLIVSVVKRLLRFVKFQKLQSILDKNEFFTKVHVNINLEKVILIFIRVFVVLLLVLVGAELFGFTVISNEIGDFIAYMPRLFVALAIFVAGIYFASWIKKTIVGLLKAIDFSGARLIGTLVFYVIFVFVAITALNQAGIDTGIITNNISIIIGAAMLTMVLSLGLGSKDVVSSLLHSFYARKNIEIGKNIRINDEIEGYVLSVDNIYLCLLVNGKKNYLPIKTIADSKIEILD